MTTNNLYKAALEAGFTEQEAQEALLLLEAKSLLHAGIVDPLIPKLNIT